MVAPCRAGVTVHSFGDCGLWHPVARLAKRFPLENSGGSDPPWLRHAAQASPYMPLVTAGCGIRGAACLAVPF